MAEWLTLLVLLPVVVVPVVLAIGFAGCSFEGGVGPAIPVIDAAVGQRPDTIRLTWTYSKPAASFEFERTLLPGGPTETFSAAASPFDDRGLDNPGDVERLRPAGTYQYRVRAIHSDGEPSFWSSEVSGTTLPVSTVFEWDDDERAVSRSTMGWLGYSLVQRIEPDRLESGGARVRITLRAGSIGASVDRVFISRADPTSDPYDSAGDLTALEVTPFSIAANGTVSLGLIDYNLDPEQALLIAVDFSAAPDSSALTTDQTPAAEALSHYKAGASDAGNQDRTDFTSFAGISLVEKIEVG